MLLMYCPVNMFTANQTIYLFDEGMEAKAAPIYCELGELSTKLPIYYNSIGADKLLISGPDEYVEALVDSLYNTNYGQNTMNIEVVSR